MGFQGTPVIPEFMRAGGVFYDDEYMPCNIVINVAASNVVLCFIHAVTGTFSRCPISPEASEEYTPFSIILPQTSAPRTTTNEFAITGPIGVELLLAV
jgi:hypothetical protein